MLERRGLHDLRLVAGEMCLNPKEEVLEQSKALANSEYMGRWFSKCLCSVRLTEL